MVNSVEPRNGISLHVMEAYDLRHETRLKKQIGAALDAGLVSRAVVAGRWRPGQAPLETVSDWLEFHRFPMPPGSRFPRLQSIRRWMAGSQVVTLARRIRPAYVECHNVATLPWGIRVKRATGAMLAYTPHELEPERNGLSPRERELDRRMESWGVPQCDVVAVVGDGIADWYARSYGVSRPLVIRNVPSLRGAEKAPVRESGYWRGRFGIPDSALVFLYQGLLCPGRRIEQLIRVFERVGDDRHVVFLGYGPMKGAVEVAALRRANIHYAPAVDPAELLRFTAAADVGLVGVENVCLSYFHSLPNKLFEYLTAGLPIIVPDFPEMTRIVNEDRCGWAAADDDEAWRRLIEGLDPGALRLASEGVGRAANRYVWSGESRRLVDAYRGKLGTKAAGHG